MKMMATIKIKDEVRTPFKITMWIAFRTKNNIARLDAN